MKIFEDLHAFLWLDPSANNCNTYFINGPRKILVDPGHEHLFGHVRGGLTDLSLTVSDIDLVIITHTHPDHMEGAALFGDTHALTAVYHTESTLNKQNAFQFNGALAAPRFEPDILLQEGGLRVGPYGFQVIHAPGHSPCSVCLYWPEKKVLFSGDVVFNQGVGRTDLPGGNGGALKESIRSLTRLEIDFLLPGHGDIVSGRDRVKTNFQEIERVWFAYL